MKLADNLGEVLGQVATHDERIFVIDGDLADSDGAAQFALRHPNRFLMGGIAEQNLVSVAAGMASCGMRPFVFSFAAFLCFRAYDQIRVGLSHSRQPVTLVGSHAGGLTFRNGKTHAALNDIALMMSLPEMHVWAPADFVDVAFCIGRVLETPAPAYVRLPRIDFGSECRLPGCAGINRWIQTCSTVNIVSTGLATHWAIEACASADAALLDLGLLHCPYIHLEKVTLAKLSVSRTIFVIEDHYESGGLGSLVKAMLPGVKVEVMAWPASFQGEQGDPVQMRRKHGLCAQAIVTRILSHIKYNT